MQISDAQYGAIHGYALVSTNRHKGGRPIFIIHALPEMIHFYALSMAGGYPDGNDCDALCRDPAFKMAVGRLPDSEPHPRSHSTISRLENAPGPIALRPRHPCHPHARPDTIAPLADNPPSACLHWKPD
jgi:hypothetical protein